MKIKVFMILVCLFILALGSFAQTNNARQFDKFGVINCEMMMLRADYFVSELRNYPKAKGYIIFYEGRHGDKNPRFGEARNFSKEIIRYLTGFRGYSANNFLLIDGGYRENFEVEHWIVPQGAKSPSLTPTLKRKDIKFRKGNPSRVRICSRLG